MEEAFLFGQMVEDTKDSTLMIKNRVMDSLIGQMEDVIKEVGKTENRMEKVYIQTLLENKDKVFGVMVKK
jgi:hypothetical protein